MVTDLKEGMQLTSVLLVKGASIKSTRKMSLYLDLELADKSGSINGKMWDYNSNDWRPEVGDVVRVSYTVVSYNDKLQLEVNGYTQVADGEYDPALLFPVSKKDPEVMWGAITQLRELVKDKSYSTLLHKVFDNEDFVEKFKVCSGATRVHHAFVSGLLEHTLGVTKLVVKIGSVVPEVDMELLVTSALLHDVGKTVEYSTFPKNAVTRFGGLVGHVSYGAALVYDLGKDCVDRTKLEQVMHCILSHHGKLEWGSPVPPALIEAFILHTADNLDSKLEIYREALGDANFSEEAGVYNKYLEATVHKTI